MNPPAIIASVLLAAGTVHGADAEARFFAALAQVEGKHGTSDRGQAMGPYQIHVDYLLDALEFRTSLDFGVGCWRACRNEGYGRQIVRAYLQRYARRAWRRQDWKRLAMVHNGGPSIFQRGHEKARERAERFAQRVVNLMGP